MKNLDFNSIINDKRRQMISSSSTFLRSLSHFSPFSQWKKGLLLNGNSIRWEQTRHGKMKSGNFCNFCIWLALSWDPLKFHCWQVSCSVSIASFTPLTSLYISPHFRLMKILWIVSFVVCFNTDKHTRNSSNPLQVL